MIEVSFVHVLENPCSFTQPFQFKVTFKVDEDIGYNELGWKIVYVGSAESNDFDQTLLCKSFGPFQKGQHDIILCSAPVDPNNIPKEEIVASSVVFLVGFYRGKQFFQVGYFVNNQYEDDEDHEIIELDKLQRTVCEQFPRIFVPEEVAIHDDGDFTNHFDDFQSISDVICSFVTTAMNKINLSSLSDASEITEIMECSKP